MSVSSDSRPIIPDLPTEQEIGAFENKIKSAQGVRSSDGKITWNRSSPNFFISCWRIACQHIKFCRDKSNVVDLAAIDDLKKRVAISKNAKLISMFNRAVVGNKTFSHAVLGGRITGDTLRSISDSENIANIWHNAWVVEHEGSKSIKFYPEDALDVEMFENALSARVGEIERIQEEDETYSGETISIDVAHCDWFKKDHFLLIKRYFPDVRYINLQDTDYSRSPPEVADFLPLAADRPVILKNSVPQTASNRFLAIDGSRKKNVEEWLGEQLNPDQTDLILDFSTTENPVSWQTSDFNKMMELLKKKLQEDPSLKIKIIDVSKCTWISDREINDLAKLSRTDKRVVVSLDPHAHSIER